MSLQFREAKHLQTKLQECHVHNARIACVDAKEANGVQRHRKEQAREQEDSQRRSTAGTFIDVAVYRHSSPMNLRSRFN